MTDDVIVIGEENEIGNLKPMLLVINALGEVMNATFFRGVGFCST